MKRRSLTWFVVLCFFVSLFGGTAALAAWEYSTDGSIIFSGSNVRIIGTGLELDKDSGDVHINAGGTYALKGSGEGRVVVKAGETEDVTMILSGLDLTCETKETIYVKSAGSAALVLMNETENKVVSGRADTGEYDEEEATGAAIRAKCPLTITGSGALDISGYIKNAVTATGDLTIDSGSLTVYAVNDGITSKANIAILGGTFSVTAGHDAIQAGETLAVEAGSFDIFTGVGATEADMKTGDSNMMAGGAFRGPSAEPSEDADTGSHKGLKAGERITITGGTFTLDTQDDAVHCDGDILISGGDLAIYSGDDGIHGDNSLVISGGSIDVRYCFEGLEAPDLLISDGHISIAAEDDGMNANGGSMMFGPSREASGEESNTPILRITGGTVYVDAGGDGLDSNGDLYIEGGEVYVSGPSTNWDSPIDYGEGGSEFLITGGTVMAAGYAGMAESPDSTDMSQPCIFYVADTYFPEGTPAVLTDGQGNILAEYAFVHSYNCVLISLPDLTLGKTYILWVGDMHAEIELTETLWTNQIRGGFAREQNQRFPLRINHP